jgi:hypothetical protein
MFQNNSNMTVIIPETDSEEYVGDAAEISEPLMSNDIKRKGKIQKSG